MLIYRPTIISGSGYYSGSFDGDGSRLYNLISSSYAITASYALNAGGGGVGVGFPFSGSAVISGSLVVSGSYVDFSQVNYITGSNLIVNKLNVLSELTASGLNYPAIDGIAGQVIETDGAGNLFFGNLDTIVENVKNVSGYTLYKGTPVHATGSGTSGNLVGVIAASASVASTMPATFILAQTLTAGAEGLGIISGLITGVNTSAFKNGQVIYVGASGGYTNVAPTGSNLIQNLGIITKVHPTNGGGVVLGAGRANATPNLLNGQIFYGVENRSVARPLADIVSGSIFNYTGSFSGDGSSLTNITVSEVNTVTASFASTSSITVVHNFNTKNVIISAYDSDDFYFVPETIKLVDNNRVKLTFSNPSTGYAVVAKGGHIVSGSLYIAGPQGFQGNQGPQGNQGSTGLQGTTGAQGNQGPLGLQGSIGAQGFQGNAGTNVSETYTVSASFSATSSITIAHNFNSKNVIVSTYDSSDVYFIPQSLKLVDENKVKLTFTSPSTGYVVVAKGGHIVSGSLFIPGPQGFQGPLGYQGFQGSQGPTGTQGVQGSKGEIVNGLLYTTTISGSIITINHNTDNTYPLFAAYNQNKIAVQPKTVLSINPNTIEVDFGTFFTGSISVGGSGLKGNKGDKGNFKGEKGTKGQKGNDIFPFFGTAIITGSLNVSNSSSFSHIIPKQNNLYDLGSPTKRWRDIYLTSASIYLGNTKISANNQGRLSIINSENPSQKTIGDYSGSFTGSIKLPVIPQGTTETNILLVNNDGNLVYRSNLSLTGSQGPAGSNAGITSYTNPADNRVITAVSSTEINAEENLTFDGSILDVNTTAVIKLPVGTTAERPISPTVGMIRWSTTISKFEFYDGTVWLGIDGTPTGIALGVATFAVAAGGGGGGASAGPWGGSGAGGAGGYRTSYGQSGGGASAESTLSIATATNYTVTVGAGGNGATTAYTRGGSGTNSIFSTITSIGGGGGAGSTGNGTGTGLSGGSGGGGAYSGGAGGAGTINQGYAGSNSSTSYGGGGGGAGGAGSAGVNPNSGAGIGVASTITDSSVTFSRGGDAQVTGVVNGDANSGYGGSTAYAFAFNGGNGGSGVVIIRYSSSYTISNPGGGLTFSTISVLNDKVTTFTAGTGNIQFN
jgi:hypothetical protein